MPKLDWSQFAALSGSPSSNFQDLWRTLVRRHYGKYGEFRELAQQPGVEFHLRLQSPCDLGEPERWYGWQCKWYDIERGRPLGSTRRAIIADALEKSQRHLPGLTDWVLCTRHPLTKRDQEWFFGTSYSARLHAWTSVQLEEHLHGPGEIFRRTYFGDLILTPERLQELHVAAAAGVQHVWRPEVHQEIRAERHVARLLGRGSVRTELLALASRFETGIAELETVEEIEAEEHERLRRFLHAARSRCRLILDAESALGEARLEWLRDELESLVAPQPDYRNLARQLRAKRRPWAPHMANAVADMDESHESLRLARRSLACSLVGMVAPAGNGKTELAVQLTAKREEGPAGLILHGRDLGARESLDDLAGRGSLYGERVQTFDALLSALDAAGRRAGHRLPLVIDGLNEAEDPRTWKAHLGAIQTRLKDYPYLLVVCTLRNDYVPEALPDDTQKLSWTGFERDLVSAVRRYFEHYRIDATDSEVPKELLDHPLTLRVFCEVTNPTRSERVGIEAMPLSLTDLFDSYIKRVARRIEELSPVSQRYRTTDVLSALQQIGRILWDRNSRGVPFSELRRTLGDEGRVWHESIVRALEQDGVLTRHGRDSAMSGESAVVYDALAGHVVATALVDRLNEDGTEFEEWFSASATRKKLFGDYGERHPLARDLLKRLAGVIPREAAGRQVWPLLAGRARIEALCEAARLDKRFIDGATVTELRRLIRGGGVGSNEVLDITRSLRSAPEHPLNADFLDATLRPMASGDRDLVWTEWIRLHQDALWTDLERAESRWLREKEHDERERLRATWVMWVLTTTVRPLRDKTTRALYLYGRHHPEHLYGMAIDSLGIDDQYVAERMLAAAYGVGMALAGEGTTADRSGRRGSWQKGVG